MKRSITNQNKNKVENVKEYVERLVDKEFGKTEYDLSDFERVLRKEITKAKSSSQKEIDELKHIANEFRLSSKRLEKQLLESKEQVAYLEDSLKNAVIQCEKWIKEATQTERERILNILNNYHANNKSRRKVINQLKSQINEEQKR